MIIVRAAEREAAIRLAMARLGWDRARAERAADAVYLVPKGTS